MPPLTDAPLRHLVLVLGDQLDRGSDAFAGFDPTQDAVWMAEVSDESTQVWSAKQRTVLFLSAMRHFAETLRTEGCTVLYRTLTDSTADTPNSTLADELLRTLSGCVVQRLRLVEPGDHRVRTQLEAAASARRIPLDLLPDTHFLCSTAEFANHAKGRKQLRMEYFYREMRRRHGVLLQADGSPAGGAWNFDADNRQAFPARGPGCVPDPPRFAPDAITQDVIALVSRRFASHPGSVARFGWPVTREQALRVLHSFVEDRLEHFGQWQDAMWAGQPWLYHAHISAALNLKLLNPREVIHAAEQAYAGGRAPLAAVEGFVRQVLGWREYVRGIYWLKMPAYGELNALGATDDLPAWFWTGATDMRCLNDAITQTLEHGYAHHIQRLMVTGLYALLHGVSPRQVHAWYLAVYVDAVEWVELPNVLGMSQFADGGVMASKPYAATGKYIERMSNHCAGCRYQPALRTGEQACPFTTLYWDFLARHQTLLARNPRMTLQVKNLLRITPAEMTAIAERARAIRSGALDTAPSA
ncbi:MAG: cryptochrome/photolyase family protein [Gammaproteobacteria bacterium]|nr:cryptochrome/photolyase family protein [Gammaproteobacteria bacterium]